MITIQILVYVYTVYVLTLLFAIFSKIKLDILFMTNCA